MTRRVVLLALLILSLLTVGLPSPAIAHEGEDHVPPSYSAHGADSSVITLRDVGPRLAQILDSLTGPRWRTKNWPTAKLDACFENITGLPDLEKDLCALWESQVIDSNIQPGARPYSCPWPEYPPGRKCIDIDQTFDRNYGADIIWNAIFNAYINNVAGEDTSGYPPKWKPSESHQELIYGHGRRHTGIGPFQDPFSSSLMNFSWPCGDEARHMYEVSGGGVTCNHGRAYQIYTDIPENATGSYINRVARLSYPDLQIVEPFSRDYVPQSKWNPTEGFEPQFGGAEPMLVSEFKMWTGRMYCSLLASTGSMVSQEIEITEACSENAFGGGGEGELTQSYWWDGGMTPASHGPHWNNGSGGLGTDNYSYLSRWWGWDDGPEPSGADPDHNG